jgi:hypothetical protein
LKGARCEKPSQVRRGGTQGRTDAKKYDPKNQCAAPTEAVAHSAAEQEQSAERQEIGVNHPLEAFWITIQALPDGRQHDIDDRAVNEGETGG